MTMKVNFMRIRLLQENYSNINNTFTEVLWIHKALRKNTKNELLCKNN